MRCIAVSLTRPVFFIYRPLFLAAVLSGAGALVSFAEEGSAIGALRQRADRGEAEAMNALGEFYLREGATRDDAAALRWYMKAAAQGDVEAAYHVGLAYEQGRGVGKDRVQAQQWYGKAVEQGHARAAFNLALMLEGGPHSVTEASSAAALYRKSAEQGFAPAQNNYGLLLAEGRGATAPNLVESFAWLTIAVENGANASGHNLVGEKLSSIERVAATERVSVLRAQLKSGKITDAPVQVVSPVSVLPLAPTNTSPDKPADRLATVSSSAGANADLVAKLNGLSGQIDELTRTNTALRSRNEVFTLRNADLLSQIASDKVERDGTERESSTAAWIKERENFEAQAQSAAIRIARLEGDLLQARLVAEAAAKTITEQNGIVAKNAELVAQLQTLSDTTAQLRQELNTANVINTRLTTELKASTEMADRTGLATSDTVNQRDQFRVQLAAGDVKLATLTQQLNDEASAARLRSSEFEARSLALIRSAEELTSQNDQLRAELNGLEKAGVSPVRLAELESALDHAQARVQEVESGAATLDTIQRELLALRNENARLSSRAQLLEAERRNQMAALPMDPSKSAPRVQLGLRTADSAALASRRPAAGAVLPRTTVIAVPPTRPSRPGVASGSTPKLIRWHTVVAGESLTRISVRYYGTGNRWSDIYQKNRETLRGQNALRIGQQLVLP